MSEKNLNLFLLETIVENIPSAVFIKDVQNNFKVIIWNKKAEEIFEIAKEDIVGKTFHDLWPKEEADFYFSIDNQVMNDGQKEIGRAHV